jgi:hypothetical protein
MIPKGRYYAPGTCGGTVAGGKLVSLVALDGPEVTIVDCGAEDVNQRHLNVLEGSNLRITGLTLLSGGSDSVEQGGCILLSGASTITLANAILKNCRAQFGGAIHASQESAVLVSGDSILQDNNALFDGGSLYLEQSSLTMTGRAKVVDSKAANGGGVSASQSSIILRDFAKFELCRATTGGGGIAASKNSRLNLAGEVTFFSCASGGHGGALQVTEMSTVVIIGLSTISNVSHFQFLACPVATSHMLT